MIADDGVTPILMDFGSTVKARIRIDNRSLALLQQVYATLYSLLYLISCLCHRILPRNRAQWHTALQNFSM
jgi:hypothetical protein